MEKKKSLLLKILIPVAIIATIAVMWIIKNNTENKTALTETLQTTQNFNEMPEHLKDADFSLNAAEEIDFSALAEYGLPVIADYGADSCIPCKEMAPVLKTMNSEMYGKAFIKFVDVWKYGEAAANVPIQIIPTQVFFNADGSPFVPSNELAAEIEFIMYSDRESNEHAFTVHQGGLTEEQMRKILKEMGVE